MSQTICRHGNKADNLTKAIEKRSLRRLTRVPNHVAFQSLPVFDGLPSISKRPAMRRKIRRIVKQSAWRDFLRNNKGLKVFRTASFMWRLKLMGMARGQSKVVA